MSSANACLSVSSVIALPPYFTTIVLPWYCFSHGSASARVAALAVACFQARVDVGVVGARSSSLSARVGGVLVHVGVREVVGPHGGARVAGLEVDGHADLALLQVDARRVLVGRRPAGRPRRRSCATSRSAGSKAASVVPMEASTRPQLGSLPKTADLNRALRATDAADLDGVVLGGGAAAP